ncbi:hypothetical protein H4582DRAFT_2056961 [Lactarius indigo]|nr:hypothetical protein H4582DRAFT_2056961 [Lactarius indigo]
MIRCAGCNKYFTHSGHSQHISKTRRPDCQNLRRSLQTHSTSRLAHAGSSLAPNTSAESWRMEDEPIGDWEDEIDSYDNGFSSDSSSQQSHEDATPDSNDGGDVDSTDANTFEAIFGERNFSSVVTPELEHADEPQSLSPPPEPPIPEACNPDTRPISFVDRFPHGHPGAPVAGTPQVSSTYGSTRHELRDSVWAPFRSQCDWEFAHWAKTCGATASAVTALLAIPELVDKLGLSYRTSTELNDIIDKALPGRPSFRCEDMNLGDECLQFHYREIIPCIRSLFGNPEFAHRLVFAPERHYADAERTCRVYNEMHTGDWWWSVQVRNSFAIWVQMLIGYIPTTKLTGITNKAARRRAIANLFHSCMERVLRPIHAIGETGLAMRSGDGIWCRCHPILATFVGDYPEQGLVACTRFGRCPKCLVPVDQLGNYIDFPARNHVDMVDTYMLAICQEAGLKPIFRPFWTALPLVDIFLSITPDVLHQLLQGVVKHVKAWLTRIFGAAEVDARCRTLPPNHHITLFAKGITTLTHFGKRAQEHLPNPSRTHRQLSPSRQTLQRLEECLARFHENKDVFIDLGVRRHMDLPKVHSLLHYRSSITLFGTTDNYNTEQFERLHIDFTKDAYRATNRKDEYSQMTVWLECREKVRMHTAFVEWQEQNDLTSPPISATSTGPLRVGTRYLKMTQHPTVKAVTFDELATSYGAIDFQDALADFIALINYPSASAAALRSRAADTLLPFRSVPVFHRVKFTSRENSEDFEIVDSVVIRPVQKDAHGRTVPERFDTVLVRGRQDIMHGNNGHRIGQVRVVFQIPSKVIRDVFLNNAPTHLAYIEWFSPLSPRPDVNHLMYKVSRSVQGGRRRATVIPVDRIMGSVHLIPRFGRATPQDWNSFSVLEKCSTFYVNSFSDRDNYLRFS